MIKTIASILLVAAGKFVYSLALFVVLVFAAALLWPFALISPKR